MQRTLWSVVVLLFVVAGCINCELPEEGQMMMVKCRNPECEAAYEVNKEWYYEYIDGQRSKDPTIVATPPLVCKKCGGKSVFQAVKCERCGLIFEVDSRPHDFEDRCPKCGHSRIEELREKAGEAQANRESSKQ